MVKWLMVLLIILLTSGCVQSDKKGLVIHTAPDLFQKKQDANISKYSNYELPSTVAILPFKSEKKEASRIVTKTFYNFFSPLPYKDIELDYIYSVAKDKNISYNMDSKNIEKIAKRLGVDGVIYGDVQNFGKLFLGIYSEVKVGARIKFYSLKQHKVIWKFDDTARKMSGGISLTPWGLATTIVLSTYNLRKIQTYRAAEDLFRDIPKIVPHPSTSRLELIPLPSTIIHSGMQKDIFGIGDKFIVSLTAQPNIKIYVEIPGVSTMLPLKEVKPGHYELSYTIQPNTNAEGYLHFLMEKKGGIQRSFYDAIAPIKIDTTKPKAPDVSIVYGDKIKVIGRDSFGDEIKEYILEVLDNGKYSELKKSKDGLFEFNTLNKSIFIRVRSVDRAKNVSDPSKPIELFLYGDSNVAKSSIYKNEKIINKPIRVESDCEIDKLYVGKNGYLIVMPKTTIKFPKDAKVNIEGTIVFLQDSKLYIKNNNGLIINDGVLKIREAKIVASKSAFMLNGVSSAYIYNSKIVSRFSAIDIKNASYLEAKNVTFDTSKSANASILISGNSYAKIKSCSFSHKPIFDIMSNSTHISTVYNSGKIKVIGEVNVIKK